jgi:orotate phosphoribosyltransferase
MGSLPVMAPARNRFETGLLRRQVFGIIKEKSFSKGTYKLVSGAWSDYYLDMKPTMLSPEGGAALSEMILDRLKDMDVDYIGGLALGAVPLISTIAAFSHVKGRPLPSFFVRKDVKDHGTMKLIEGLAPGETLSGKRVVILDDVTTKGESAMAAVRAAQGQGANVILVLSVVDREQGAADFYQGQNIPFACLFTAREFLNS